MRPRVGHIQYLNCLPLYYGLVKGNGILDLDLIKGTPTELNRLLLTGALDIGPLSSVEYARHSEELLLLPGPSVGCRGAVQSILLLSRRPLGDLQDRPVALTSESATSHVLLRIVLERRYGVQARYFTSDYRQEDPLAGADASLLIGDRALENLSPAADVEVHDLGSEWHALTGGGMVFAVWAARLDFARRRPEAVAHVWNLFRASLEFTRHRLASIADDASRWERFDSSFLERYFTSLDFDFGASRRADLLRFYSLAREIGAVPQVPELRFFEPESGDSDE